MKRFLGPRVPAINATRRNWIGHLILSSLLLLVPSILFAQVQLEILHAFPGPGAVDPLRVSLLQATDGNFYGTTVSGGAADNGTVFRMTPEGTVTILHAFARGSDGAFPYAGLIQATDGNLYGTTQGGGANGAGTIFRITLGGAFTVLHTFTFRTDGGSSWSPLDQGSGAHGP
jgi:uncharacterized repeat protein (TIGR03803 family)